MTPTLFDQSPDDAALLLAHGYVREISPFSGAEFWRTPGGRELLDRHEALARVRREQSCERS